MRIAQFGRALTAGALLVASVGKIAAADEPATWALDFPDAAPGSEENFRELAVGGITDVFALGYTLDPASISPDHKTGVIIPRAEAAQSGRCFAVDIATRKITGATECAQLSARGEPPRLAGVQVVGKTRDGEVRVEWSAEGGPLTAVLANDESKRAALPGSDTNGAAFPLCFFTADNHWLVVNRIVRVDPSTGRQHRSAMVYERVENDAAGAPSFRPALDGSFDDAAWRFFEEDAGRFTERSVSFQIASGDSGRLLFYLHARNPDGGGYIRWFCYFNAKKRQFEMTPVLSFANGELRRGWDKADEPKNERYLPLRAQDPDQSGGFSAPAEWLSLVDDNLNTSYNALLKLLPREEQEPLRVEQRAWLKSVDTIAAAYAAQRWTEFPAAVTALGKDLAISARADQLRKRALGLVPHPNTKISERSPDGRFGIRRTFADDDIDDSGRAEGIELVSIADGKSVLDLYDEYANRGSTVLWSPDSRRFAYAASSRRITEVAVYERAGDDFHAVELPDLDAFQPHSRKNEREGHFNESTDDPKRWLGPNELVVHRTVSYQVEREEGDPQELSGEFEFTIRFDAKGKARVGKLLKKKETRE